MTDVVAVLSEALGADAVLTSEKVAERASSFWDSRPMQAKALIRPRTTEDISKALKICHTAGQTIITHGGLSGCVEGGATTSDHIVISLERMNAIEEIDPVGCTATLQAGIILQSAQSAIAEAGLYFPLDLGARGSCTIGGNIATNAGGINVIRYGMARNLILGLEAVLADGTIISSMNHMLKNNAGYDIKQLFIGTEGTLGIVTRAVVKLEVAHLSRNTALAALDTFQQVTLFLTYLKQQAGSNLSAYEVMWGQYYRAVTEEGFHTSPMARDYNFYLIAECEGSDPVGDSERFVTTLEHAMENNVIRDAIIPKSETERTSIWSIREDFEAITQNAPYFLYDVSLPIKHMDAYISEVEDAMHKRWPNGGCFTLGHIGDGNLHLFVSPGEGDESLHHISDELVYRPLEKFNGSVSAEHGIGREKKAWLSICRSDIEINLMKSLKRALDSKGILNPGVVFD